MKHASVRKECFIDDHNQARDSKLTIEDIAGGTFTISNVSHRGQEVLRQLLN